MVLGKDKRWACCACLLAAVPVLAFASAGGAAPPTSTDLRIAKSDSPDPVHIGATLVYTIQVENLGPDTATAVTVTDRLPNSVDLVSATSTAGPCASKGRRVTCVLGALPAPMIDYGGPPTATISAIPRRAGTIANTATVDGAQKDPVSANNRATATTQVLGTVSCRGVAATIVGSVGDDDIAGSGGPDVIVSFGGDDTIASLAGRDLVCAGNDDDHVTAGSAADRVYAGTGRDRILGRGGPDLLRGNAGNDILKGNRGADRLRGGRGFDRCKGGSGTDSIRGCER